MLISEISGFERPFGVRASEDGGFYVVDIKSGLLSRIRSDFTRAWATAGTPAMQGPHSVAMGLDGTIYVTEYYGRRLRCFLPDGSEVATLATPTTDMPWLLTGPAGIEIFPDGRIIVADYGSHTLQRFFPDGSFDAWHDGTTGWRLDGAPSCAASKDGFDRVHAAIPLPDGRMLVADTWQHRMRIFDRKGSPDSLIGGPVASSNMGMFNAPVSIALLPDGFVVSEYENPRLQYFNFDGQVQRWLGVDKGGVLPDNWRYDNVAAALSGVLGGFWHPYDVKPYGNGLVVADTDNSRIQCITF